MDRKTIATNAVIEAAYAVRREEILASREAGETISNRQSCARAQYPALGEAARYYNNVRRTFKDVFENWEDEHDAARTGANRAETALGEPLTNQAP